MITTITSKGQVTLPKAIRDRLNLAPGTLLDFTVDEAGVLTARPVTQKASSLAGLLKRPGQKALSIEEMDDAIARAVIEKDRQSRS